MQKFLKIATPGYSSPCSRTVQRRLTKLYIKKKEEFKKELSKISSVSITTDMWRSKNNRHFVCVTVHSMDEKFICRSYVLSFKKFHGRCIAKKLRSHLVQVLKDFNLLGKITTTTTDNGSNIKLATSNQNLFGTRIHCLAHALNLTIHNGLHLWMKKKIFQENDIDEEKRSVLISQNTLSIIELYFL